MFRSIVVAAVAVLAAAATVPAAHAQETAPAAAQARASAPLNINTATAEQFEALPGLGAKTAARIVEYRQKNGGFKKLEDLMNVRGIGEKNFLRLKPLLTIGAPRPDQAATR
jgi:competence protein ComEA